MVMQDEHRPKYRADIDGVRALAVGSVVLYHAGVAGLPGGFTGVDVFFVISGFLIGGIVLKDVAAHSFSFATFYARRARRILPALLAVLAATLLLGAAILSAEEYRDLGATAFSTLIATSNVSFWRHQDYFNPDSHLLPLLMTWSLGVEEQFYVIFPVLALLARKWSQKAVRLGLAVLIALSFAASVGLVWKAPLAAFYLLPPRAWELGAGVLLAALSMGPRPLPALKPWMREGLGFTGLALVLAGFVFITQAMPFPGLLALPPVAGAVMLIMAEGSLVNRRLLSAPVMVFIGQISYSWYLWHWPLMSLVRISAATEPPLVIMLATAALSFGLAVLSWRFVERPFRQIRLPAPAILVRYAGVLAASVLVVTAIRLGHGLPQRLTPAAAVTEAQVRQGRGDCLVTFGQHQADMSPNCQAATTGQASIAILGDSHAAALQPGLKALAADRHMGIRAFTKSSCPPALGVPVVNSGYPDFAQICARFLRTSLEQIAGFDDIQTVVLGGQWMNYEEVPPAQMQAGLVQVVTALRKAGKRVVVIADVPRLTVQPQHLALAHAIPARGLLSRVVWPADQGAYPADGATPRPVEDAASRGLGLRDAVEAAGAEWRDPVNALCDKQSCRFMQDGDLLYFDTGHLAVRGSKQVVASLDLAP